MSAATLKVLGRTGLTQWGGIINEEYLPELRGQKGRDAIKEMVKTDPVVGALLFAIRMLIRGSEWSVVPPDDSPEAADVAQFFDECMDDMSHDFKEFLAECLSFLPYGWSLFEIVYKMRGGDSEDPTRRSKFTDGKIGWRKLAVRSQDTLLRWEFDNEGGIQGMWQAAPPDWIPVFIPIDKALLFRTSTEKGNPEGESILRNAYRPAYFKRHIENIEAIGIERDLAGLPVFGVPAQILALDATEQDKALLSLLTRIVQNVRRDEQEGLIIPREFDDRGNELYKLELLSTGGTRQFDTDKTITRYDQRILMSVMADFLLLGHSAVGSFALSSDKTDLFGVAIGAWLDTIAGVFVAHAFPRLMRVNNFRMDLMPSLQHSDIETPNLAELGSYVMTLSKAGVPLFPDDELENHLRLAAGFPEKPQEDMAGNAPPAVPANITPFPVVAPQPPDPNVAALQQGPIPEALAARERWPMRRMAGRFFARTG